MRCCAFGTVRIDIHVYKELQDIGDIDEIKIGEMSMDVGGSVYNTVAVLNELKQDIVLYMLNASDNFADYVRLRLHNRGLNHILCKQDHNDTATSLIFVDQIGKKKMISYDGVRKDRFILNKLTRDVSLYDLFYTSFYEINRENYQDIVKVMSLCPLNFVDLSPLIYMLDAYVINATLQSTQILSGTEDEFNTLFSLVGVTDYQELMTVYHIRYIFAKQGSAGASLYTGEHIYQYVPKEQRISHDTTGCGDTFNAAVIYALSEKKVEDEILQEAVEMATKVAYEGFDLDMFGKMR